eukprot:5584774-Heterocapsa_arctica.AAC.1
MRAANTFTDAGPTFWSHQHATTSRIYYVCLPRSLMDSGRVLAWWIDIEMGDRSQVIRSSLRPDHRPL